MAALRVALSDISQEVGQKPVRLWRPFLGEPRLQIGAFLQERRLTPLHDPSNDDVTLRRNALRHRVLPVLEEAFPGASAALARYAGLASEEDRFLEGLVDLVYPRVVGPEGLQLAELFGASVVPHDGALTLTDAPGLGLDLDERALERLIGDPVGAPDPARPRR